MYSAVLVEDVDEDLVMKRTNSETLQNDDDDNLAFLCLTFSCNFYKFSTSIIQLQEVYFTFLTKNVQLCVKYVLEALH